MVSTIEAIFKNLLISSCSILFKKLNNKENHHTKIWEKRTSYVSVKQYEGKSFPLNITFTHIHFFLSRRYDLELTTNTVITASQVHRNHMMTSYYFQFVICRHSRDARDGTTLQVKGLNEQSVFKRIKQTYLVFNSVCLHPDHPITVRQLERRWWWNRWLRW